MRNIFSGWVYARHLLLFLATVVTTLIVGTEFRTNKHLLDPLFFGAEGLQWHDFVKGIPYSLSLILFLLFHEFGHFFMAQYYQVACTLPYFIPIYIPIPQVLNIGTLGAVIQLKESPKSNIEYFDIGIAGPLAGFLVSVVVLVIGYTTLPPLTYLYEMNPDYLTNYRGIPTPRDLLENASFLIAVGHNLFQYMLEQTLADPVRLPNHYELFHYPLLFTGYLTLFFTALNLLPLGQLDGGHILFATLPREHAAFISRSFLIALVLYGGTHQPQFLGTWGSVFEIVLLLFLLLFHFSILGKMIPSASWDSRLIFSMILLLLEMGLGYLFPWKEINPLWLLYTYLITRFVGIDHPEFHHTYPLNRGRKALALLALLIFLVCFTAEPIYVMDKFVFHTLYGGK